MNRDRFKVRFYYLKPDHSVGWTYDVLEWAKRFEFSMDKRHVGYTKLKAGLEVSTVFLGIDHNFFGDRPLLFETAVLTDYGWDIRDRYSTWDEALAGHEATVKSLHEQAGDGGGEKVGDH